jgi:hypothetical protein
MKMCHSDTRMKDAPRKLLDEAHEEGSTEDIDEVNDE